MRFFTPSWQKFDRQPEGLPRLSYLFAKDVEPEWRKATYPNLNEGRRMAVRFYWFTSELNNGGLQHYFWNPSGKFAADQIQDFFEIGCPNAGNILTSATRKLFGTSIPAVDITERRRQIDASYVPHLDDEDDHHHDDDDHDHDHDQLSLLSDKDDLKEETEELQQLEKTLAMGLCSWFRANPQYFTRLQ